MRWEKKKEEEEEKNACMSGADLKGKEIRKRTCWWGPPGERVPRVDVETVTQERVVSFKLITYNVIFLYLGVSPCLSGKSIKDQFVQVR